MSEVFRPYAGSPIKYCSPLSTCMTAPFGRKDLPQSKSDREAWRGGWFPTTNRFAGPTMAVRVPGMLQVIGGSPALDESLSGKSGRT